ncbi:MAG: DUF3800 domain-containing protein [Nannocystaceae bacterium]
MNTQVDAESAGSLQQAVASGKYQMIFIDDGGAGPHQLEERFLVQGHILFSAVALLPDASWNRFHEKHREWLDRARKAAPGVTELHATEIINPKKKSPWKGVDMSVRGDLLLRAAEYWTPCLDRILMGEIGKTQYDQLLQEARGKYPESDELGRKDYGRHDYGLELNFQKALYSYAEKTMPAILIQDAGRYEDQFVEMYTPSPHIWGNGIAHFPSHEMPGIQAADLVAVLINRQRFLKARRADGKPDSPLDQAAEAGFEVFRDRIFDIWSVPI